MGLQVVCPGCGNRLPVDDTLIGKQIRCGGCEVVIDVPDSKPESKSVAIGTATKPKEPTTQQQPAIVKQQAAVSRQQVPTMEIVCPCRARLTIPVSARGTQQRCPTCKNLIYVPSPSAPTPPSTMGAGIGGLPNSMPSALPTTSRTGQPLQNPYRRRPQARPASNKPIIITAIISFAVLAFVVGGLLVYQVLNDRQSANTETSDATQQVAHLSGDTAKSNDSTVGTTTSAFPPELQSSVDQPESVAKTVTPGAKADRAPVQPVAMTAKTPSMPTATNVMSESSPQPDRPKQIKPRVLPPGDDKGLQRIHLSEGYSFAVPAGFTAQPRAINGKTGIYVLQWPDNTQMIFSITDDRTITADSAVGNMSRLLPRSQKLKVRPLTSPNDHSQIETVKLDGMNACFLEMEEDISHGDRTEELQRLFSGAMPAEAKHQMADQMRAVTAFRGAYIMRAVDERRILDVVLVGTRGKSFRPPEQWYNILLTIRHESTPDPARIPPPFVKRR